MDKTSLLDAVRVVKETERIALTDYAETAKKVYSPVCITLFENLSVFEQYHYDKLSALERSLEETGEFIHYEGKDFPLPPVLEIRAVDGPQQKSAMDIVAGAMDLEREAARAYADLAERITDPLGHAMFVTLSGEERIHYKILAEIYDQLSTFGTMKWVGKPTDLV